LRIGRQEEALRKFLDSPGQSSFGSKPTVG
jgi:hypothetical protein